MIFYFYYIVLINNNRMRYIYGPAILALALCTRNYASNFLTSNSQRF